MNELPSPDSPFWKSSALEVRSKHWPKRFGARIPMAIKMNLTVRPDYLCLLAEPGAWKDCVLREDEIYYTTVNSHGAVCGICDNGKALGVKPDEFEVVGWFDPATKTASA